MTRAAAIPRMLHLGNDVATSFSFPYKFVADADLYVVHRDTDGIETEPTLGVDYTVTGAGDAAGGSITFPIGATYSTLGSGPPAEKLAIILRDEYSNDVDYQGSWSFSTVNADNDKKAGNNQQLKEELDRSITIPVTDPDAVDLELPIDTVRASKNLIFLADGSVSAGSVITNVITSGSGVPTSTPATLGDMYIDETNNHVYVATGTASSADWTVTTKTIRYMDFSLFKFDADVETGTNLYGDHVMKFGGTILQSDTNKQWLMANNTTAGVTGTMVIDIHKNGTTIMDTNKLDIETGEKTTEDATTQPDLTVTTVAAGDIITIDVDAIHSGTAAKGLSVTMTVLED